MLRLIRLTPSTSFRAFHSFKEAAVALNIKRQSFVTPLSEPAVVSVGDVFAGKYTVAKLLGTGTRSSIWLVQARNAGYADCS